VSDVHVPIEEELRMIQKTGAGSYTLADGDSFLLRMTCAGTGMLADGAIHTQPVEFTVAAPDVTIPATLVTSAPESFLGTIRVFFTDDAAATAQYTLQVVDSAGTAVDELTATLPPSGAFPRKARFGLRFNK
jgi:hypothetical protein